MDVNEYRRRNPRCRTCQHARDVSGMYCYNHFLCVAKNRLFNGKLAEAKLRGIFCGLYTPKEEKG